MRRDVQHFLVTCTDKHTQREMKNRHTLLAIFHCSLNKLLKKGNDYYQHRGDIAGTVYLAEKIQTLVSVVALA